MLKITQIAVAVLLLVQNSLQATTVIDVSGDVPINGPWTMDCALGYAPQVRDFRCSGEGINIPPDQLNGEVGFWTKCASRCQLTYNVLPGDTMYVATLYQSNLPSEVTLDGGNTDFINGDGWLNFTIPINGTQRVTLSLNHLAPDFFTILDKIVIESN